MPLQLPNLDDRTYNDLLEEARSLIPTYAPAWTNHNPSDPGIMLIELFAYLSEMLIYRLNRVTDANLIQFLKLLNGPDWTPTADLRTETRLAVVGARERFRAITCGDFELLATQNFNQWLVAMQQKEQQGAALDEWWQLTGLDATQGENLPTRIAPIRRAHCVPRQYLDAGTELTRRQTKPGHLSLIILPDADHAANSEWGPQPSPPLLQALWRYLDERRLLTTRHHVVGPFYTPIGAEILVAQRSDAVAENIRIRIQDELHHFLDPLTGGPDAEGWPFGRPVYLSEFYELLEKVDGVDYLPDIVLTSDCLDSHPRCVPAEPIWHANGDLVGLQLAEHQLPTLRLSSVRILIAPNRVFLAVQVAVTVTAAPTADHAIVRQQLRTRLRRLFHPFYEGPRLDAAVDTTIRQTRLEQEITAVPGVTQVQSFLLRSDLTHLRTEDGKLVLTVKAGEVIDLRLQIEVV